jgi:hypothetical protein
MGEIAEDMIDGTCCSLCGCYFRHPKKDPKTGESIGIYTHGYPVVCLDCWDDLTNYDRQFVRKAEVETL